MKLQVVRSPKHPDALFLKIQGTKDHFICKVYGQKIASETGKYARIIVKAFKDVQLLETLKCKGVNHVERKNSTRTTRSCNER